MDTKTDAASLAAAPAKSRPYKITIGQGLYLLVNPNGSKLWRLKYYFGRQEKGLALGAFPAISLEQACHARDEARAMVKGGTDPSEVRKAERAEHQPQRARAKAFRWTTP